jgi:uncharacterized OB-fold protein
MAENLAITWRRIPERYKLEGCECKTCSTKFFPPRKLCPKCRRKGEIDAYRFCGFGTVYSYSEVHSAPAGLELEVPYVLAIVQLDEGPKLTAQLVECEGKDVKIGDKVEFVFRRIRQDDPEGLLHYGYKFRRVG